MNNWNFFNPVDVAFGEGRFAELQILHLALKIKEYFLSRENPQ